MCVIGKHNVSEYVFVSAPGNLRPSSVSAREFLIFTFGVSAAARSNYNIMLVKRCSFAARHEWNIVVAWCPF